MVKWHEFIPSDFEYDFENDKLAEHRITFNEAAECFFSDFQVRRNKKYRDRYQLIGSDDKTNAKFLAIYEFDSPSDVEAFPQSQAFKDAIDDFDEKNEALGFKMRWVAAYELISELER